MQLLEVSCAVRRIYTSLGAKGLIGDVLGRRGKYANTSLECVIDVLLMVKREISYKNIGFHLIVIVNSLKSSEFSFNIQRNLSPP